MPRALSLRQRVLSLWFPELACDRISRRAKGASWRSRGADEPPRAVAARIVNAQRLTGLSSAARACGLKLGDTLADARARVPQLAVEEAEPEADEALLNALADWCDRYTPLVALDGTDGLFLDITGCPHLFGGEDALLADVLGRLEAQGFAAKGAIADTPGAAWAVARYGPGGCVPQGAQKQALAGLPLAALRLDAQAVDGLERVGLKTAGALYDRPRAPLAARFGTAAMARLDQALGHQGEPISPRLATPLLMAERRFFEPIGRVEDVQAVILGLAQRLAEALEVRAQGGRAFELGLFRVDGAVQRIVVGTSRPLRTPARVLALFAEKLKADETVLDTGYGYDLVRLGVLEAQDSAPEQVSLAGGGQDEADLAGLIDRLGARLGLARVGRFLPGDRHLPEMQTAIVPAATVREDALAWLGETGRAADAPLDRPLRLLEPAEPVEAVAMVPEGPPLRFRWRKALYQVRKSEGPERIAPPWWVGAPENHGRDRQAMTRDYFRIEDGEGRRYWLYREGLYERETGAPRWYMHGLFA